LYFSHIIEGLKKWGAAFATFPYLCGAEGRRRRATAANAEHVDGKGGLSGERCEERKRRAKLVGIDSTRRFLEVFFGRFDAQDAQLSMRKPIPGLLGLSWQATGVPEFRRLVERNIVEPAKRRAEEPCRAVKCRVPGCTFRAVCC
jgi:hypothetical protein